MVHRISTHKHCQLFLLTVSRTHHWRSVPLLSTCMQLANPAHICSLHAKIGTAGKIGMAVDVSILWVSASVPCVLHSRCGRYDHVHAAHCDRSDFSAFLIALSLRFSSSRFRMSFSSCFTPEVIMCLSVPNWQAHNSKHNAKRYQHTRQLSQIVLMSAYTLASQSKRIATELTHLVRCVY